MSIGKNETPDPATGFSGLLDRCRRYWMGRRVAEGFLVALTAIAVLALIGVMIMDQARFDPPVVAALRQAMLVVTLLLLAALVLVPALRRVDDIKVAAYLEKRDPSLDALMLSAVEARDSVSGESDGSAQGSAVLSRRLLRRATEAGLRAWDSDGRDRGRLRRALIGVLIVAIALLALAVWGPGWLRHGLGLMLLPSADALVGSPYQVTVQPGDTRVTGGEDLEVSAAAVGFDTTQMTLHARRAGEERWTAWPMQSLPGTQRYTAFLFNLDAATDYYVAADRLESQRFRIDVEPRPEVQRIDLHYHFPQRSGRASERVVDGGDIRAVVGTRVQVIAVTNRVVEQGDLVVDGSRRTPLVEHEDGWVASLDIRESGRYRIELPGVDGEMLVATPEYVITALEDRGPEVAIERPSGDVQPTSVEEVEIEVSATDDLAIRGLELRVSVNGGAEQVFELDSGSSPRPRRSGRHVFYLEDLDLAPGDLIAYHARAWDSEQAGREVSTDLQFMEIRPFERRFRTGRSGGSGAGGGGQNEETLTSQQRALVVALFKVVRDASLMEPEELSDGLDTLVQAQSRIRTRVEAVSRRLQARRLVELNPGYKKMSEELPAATAAMVRAEAFLDVEELSEALPHARKALSHLQRADAAFRDVTVAQSRGGGGQNSDLTNLFRLELDKLRNQYAEVNRGQSDARQTELDEVMRRLQELARRQQRETERARLRAEQGVSGSDSQRALLEDLEALERELERLTREQDSERLRAGSRRLQQAADQMRQAASGEGSEEAERQALQRLQQAHRELSEEGRSRSAEGIGEALQRAEALGAEQRAVEGDLKDLSKDQATRGEAVSRLLRRKQSMVQQTEELEADLARLAQETRAEQPDAADKLREALTGIRESTLIRRIERSGRRLARNPEAYKPSNEDAISGELKRLRQRLRAAADGVREPDGVRNARARTRLQDMIRERSLGQRRWTELSLRSGPESGGADSRAGGGRIDADGADVDSEQIGRWSRADAENLAAVAADLPTDGRVAQDIEALIDELQEDAERPWEAVERGDAERLLAERLRALQQIEMALRPIEEAPQWTPLATMEVPPRAGDRKAVETYFRNLSERSGSGAL